MGPRYIVGKARAQGSGAGPSGLRGGASAAQAGPSEPRRSGRGFVTARARRDPEEEDGTIPTIPKGLRGDSIVLPYYEEGAAVYGFTGDATEDQDQAEPKALADARPDPLRLHTDSDPPSATSDEVTSAESAEEEEEDSSDQSEGGERPARQALQRERGRTKKVKPGASGRAGVDGPRAGKEQAVQRRVTRGNRKNRPDGERR